MAAPVHQNHSQAQATAVTSMSVPKPTGTVEGDFLMLVVQRSGGTLAAPSGWTFVDSVVHTLTESHYIAVYTKVAGASEPANYTLNFSNPFTNWVVASICRITGSFNHVNAVAKNTNTLICPSATTSVNDCLVYRLAERGTHLETQTAPSGTTERWNLNYGGGQGGMWAGCATHVQATAGATGTAEWTSTSSTNIRVVMTVAITPADAPAFFPPGIASAQAFGTTQLVPGPIDVSPSGIASAEAFGAAQVLKDHLFPTSIASQETHGSTQLQVGNVNISPSGIASAEAVGTPQVTAIKIEPAGLASGEAFGTASLTVDTSQLEIHEASIIDDAAFGDAVITGGALVIQPAGLASEEAVGTPVIETDGPITLVKDTFTDTAGTAIQDHAPDSGGTWALHPSYTQGSVISDANRARYNGTAGSTSAYFHSALPPSPNYDIECDIVLKSSGAADGAGPVARMSTTEDTGYHFRYLTSAAEWQLYKIVGGVLTLLDSAPEPYVDETVFLTKWEVTDSLKKVYKWNGSSWDEILSTTDNEITAVGRIGFRFTGGSIGSDTDGVHLDSLNASITPPEITPSGIASAETVPSPTVQVDSQTISGAGSISSPGSTSWFPSLDISNGGWQTQAGGTTDLFQGIDDQVTNDADYVRAAAPANATYEVKLEPITPGVVNWVKYRHRKQATGTLSLTVELLEGTTVLQTWVHPSVTTDWLNASRRITATVTNWSDLRLRFTANTEA